MITLHVNPVSKRIIQDLIKCEEKELNNNVTSINPDNLEYSIGYLYSKGLIETKKQVVEGIVQVCTFLTVDGSLLLEKYGLIMPKLITA